MFLGRISGMARCRYVALVFAAVSLLYAVILPPFEVPDELAHFAKAAQLAYWAYPSVHQGEQVGAMLPHPLWHLTQDWRPGSQGQTVTPLAVSRALSGLTARAAAGPAAFTDLAYLGSYPPVLYWPQALGLRGAAMAGLPPLAQFYAGRLAAGLLAVAIILGALVLLPLGRRAVLGVAVLPGISSQLATYSADSMIFALAFLTIAMVLHAQARPASRARLVLPVLIPLLTLAKGVYLPLAACGLAGRGAWRRASLAWLLAGTAVGLAAFVLWFGVLAGGDMIRQHFVSHRTLQHVVSAAPAAQAGFMAAHPVFAGRMIITTLLQRMPVYGLEVVGRFGLLSVLLPLPLYGLGAAVAVCGAAAHDAMPGRVQRGVWLGLALIVALLVHVALYLTASTLGEDYVEGVQGRYLVPALPLVMLALLWRGGPRVMRGLDAVWPWAACLLMAGGLATAAVAFWKF